jgi:flagellar motor component MotA
LSKGQHHLLLIWLIFTGIIVFSLVLAWQENILGVLYSSDKSRISWAISLLYILVTIHCARRVYTISKQLNGSSSVEFMIRNISTLKLNLQDDKVYINGESILPDCVVTDYIHDLLNKANSEKENNDANVTNAELIEVYESKLKGAHDIGWFVSDVMIKMGLLGTIIGFILMLGSVANITDFDVTTMRKILSHMSTGMGTALYTTLAGLVCSMLSAAQYHMLDRSVDELIETTKHLTQVYVLPRLK